MKGFGYLFALILVIGIGFSIAYYNAEETVVITVTGKERIVEASGSGDTQSVSSKYLVFTASETFENTDMLWIGKFNSSDIQGRLVVDSTYTAVVYGWRVPFLSMYRNIGEIR